MKKLNVVAVLALMMTAVVLGGCGNSVNEEVTENAVVEDAAKENDDKQDADNDEKKNENNEDPEDASEISGDDILTELEMANTFDALVEKYGPVLVTVTDVIDPSGEEFVYYSYQDNDKYVSMDDVEYYIYGNDMIYGGYTEEGVVTTPYYFVFVESSMEEFSRIYRWKGTYTLNEAEHVIDKEIVDGTMIIRTEEAIDAGSDGEAYAMEFGYDSSTASKIITEYQTDEATMEINEVNIYFMVGEDKVLVSNAVVDKNADEFQVDEKVDSVINGNDKRTVTIIKDAGTADEKIYTESVEKGALVIFYTEGKYERTLYADAEYTTETEQILDQDQTIYLKRVTE